MNQDESPAIPAHTTSPNIDITTNALSGGSESQQTPTKPISEDISAAAFFPSLTEERKIPETLSRISIFSKTSIHSKDADAHSGTNTSVGKRAHKESDGEHLLSAIKPEHSSYESGGSDRAQLLALRAQTIDQSQYSLVPSKRSTTHSQVFAVKSQASITRTSFLQREPSKHPLDGLVSPTIITKINELERKVKRFKVENEVFYRYLEENDPDEIKEMLEQQAQKKLRTERQSIASSRKRADGTSVISFSSMGLTPSGRQRASISSRISVASFSSMGLAGRQRASIASFSTASIGGRAKASMASFSTSGLYKTPEKAPKINVGEKLDILMRDMDEIDTRLEKVRTHCTVTKRKIVARLEEMENRKEEIDNSVVKFQEFKTSTPLTLEKYIRFMEEWTKKSRIIADKIRLRYSALKVQFRKMTTLLAHKQLIGERLTDVDFDQLKIENLHLAYTIDQKTHLLLELKKMTSKGGLKLRSEKKMIQEKMIQKATIMQAIKQFESDIFKSDNEIMVLYKDLDNVKKKYYKYKEKFEDYTAPDVLDYIKVKAELCHVKKDLKMWQRRKHIKEMALAIEIAEMKRRLKCTKVHSSWFE